MRNKIKTSKLNFIIRIYTFKKIIIHFSYMNFNESITFATLAENLQQVST